MCCCSADHVVSNWFIVVKEYLKGGFEKRMVRIMFVKKKKIVKIIHLEVYNLGDWLIYTSWQHLTLIHSVLPSSLPACYDDLPSLSHAAIFQLLYFLDILMAEVIVLCLLFKC